VQTKTDAKLISTHQRRFSLTSFISCRANERDVLLLAKEGTKVAHDDIRARLIQPPKVYGIFFQFSKPKRMDFLKEKGTGKEYW